MPSLTLNITCSKNEGIILSPYELITNFLDGIPLCYADGRHLNFGSIKRFIISSQKSIEKHFSIKFKKQIVEETKDFNRQEWNSWGYIRVQYPINEPLNLSGNVGNAEYMNYPKEWLVVKRTSDGPSGVYRNLHIIPNSRAGTTYTQQGVYLSNFVAGVGYASSSYIPEYWKVKYCTGFDKIPQDLLDIIGKLAAIQVLAMLGDILLGVGLSSLSISIDGVSQNTSTTRSGTNGLFGARIKQYKDELEKEIEIAKYHYRGISLDCA